MLIEYDPVKDQLVLTIPEQENRTVSFPADRWAICFQVIKEHGLAPHRRLQRRRAIASLGETDRKMIDRFIAAREKRSLDEVYPGAIDIDLEDL
jgi:hypothetical protein